jgi:tetratricopeptide (TPR) repeat protein
MNLESSTISSYIFKEFKEIEKRKQPCVKPHPYVEIFEKLGCQDLYQASLVCKEWKQLIEQTNLWKMFNIERLNIKFQEETQVDDQKVHYLIPKDELKTLLESLEHEKILSEEEIKEIENAYKKALPIAVQAKEATQKGLYIERLGDVYSSKEIPKILLQAAGLYNYALHHSSLGEQEIIKRKLLKAEILLTKLCKGKTVNNSIAKKQFEANREVLKKLREGIKEKIQALGSDPSSEEVRMLYKEIALGMKDFFNTLVNQAIDVLGPVPCEYAMIGFGSLAREEMTPYSDLEFAILIQEDSKDNKKYFKRLTALIHLKVINIGETLLPALNIPCLKAINFFDDITPRGLAFDGEGVEGKGCKTPFGNRHTFELIQTPEKMAQYIGKDEKGIWWHEEEPHLPMELLTFTHLLGDEGLTSQYKRHAQQQLATPYQAGFALRQYLAKYHLVREDRITFNPSLQDPDKQGLLFKVKNDLYRFPHLALDRLALLKEVAASDTFTRITQLKDKGILTDDAAEKLSEWMSIALFMRLKTYSHYEAQKEMMNPLLKPFMFDEPELAKQQFALDLAALKKIKKIYCVFIPFYQAVKEFLAGNEAVLKSLDVKNISPKTQGDIALRLFQQKKSKKFYKLALEKNPEDADILVVLGCIYKGQGKLDKAAKKVEEALKIRSKFLCKNYSLEKACNKNFAALYREQAKLGNAAEPSRKADFIKLKLFLENYSNIATYYNNLATIYQAQGKLGKAAAIGEKALKIDLQLWGKNHPHVARTYNNLGTIYQERGRLGQAAGYVEKALTINTKLFGGNHATVARDYNNLGQIYQEQGKLKKAAEHINKALEINQEIFGEYHPRIATGWNNLAGVYQEQGNLDKAAEFVQKAFAIDLKLFGESHPTIARDHNNLAGVYQGQGKLDEAVEQINKALAINLELFGENHASVADCYTNLGVIYQEQGSLKKAVGYFDKALAIDHKLFGENHPSIAIDYNNLSQSYEEQGLLKQALEYSKKALAIDLKLFGENHPTVVRDYNSLGIIYLNDGNLDEAFKHISKACTINFGLFGEIHPTMAINYNNLGQIYQKQSNLKQAAEYTEKALAINLKLLGEDHSTVAINYNNLGKIYQKQGNLKQAAEYAEKALNIALKLWGEHHPLLAIYYDTRGMIYKRQGLLEKAVEDVKRAVTLGSKLGGENCRRMARFYDNLSQIYHDQGNVEQAAECSHKARAINLKLIDNNPLTKAAM